MKRHDAVSPSDDNDRMIPPRAHDDWTALDPSMRREALGALKARLHESPKDLSTRREIVDAYRQLGNPDQAGRFALGLEEGARPDEIRAYSSMIRGLGAGESAARRLSLITAEVELPEPVRQAIEGRPLGDEWRPGGIYVGIAWAIWVGLGLISMMVVFSFAMAGARDVQSIAQWWTALTGWALVVALTSTTAWCAASKKWKPALVWASITIVFTACVLVISVVLLPR